MLGMLCRLKHGSGQNRRATDAIEADSIKAIIRNAQHASPAAIVGDFNMRAGAQVTDTTYDPS